MSRPSVAFPWQRALRSITAQRHLALALIICGALATFPPSAAYAQDTTSPCTDTVVAAAEEAYLNRNYQEAVTLASQCTDRSAFEDEIVIQAYRLITLASLRQGALVQARSAVTNILQIDPEYTADPVNDPPAYDLFISLVRQEKDTEGTADAEAETEKPSPAPRDATRAGSFLNSSGSASRITPATFRLETPVIPLTFRK